MARDKVGEVMAKLRQDQTLMDKLNDALDEVYAKSLVIPNGRELTEGEKAQMVALIASALVRGNITTT